ncbi:MAG: PCMD domain-containing protein [Bacteroidaceae bacterium]|nr:PCMD domain-containing protein [Bacteroidaceae bacterium]
MKNKYLFFLLLTTVFSFSSCIQDEAPNAECDIVSVDTTQTWFRENRGILTNEFKINNNDVIFILKNDADFNSIEITHESIIEAFTLTKGARIEKNNQEISKNGISLFFTTYSEDGKWSKKYEVKFIKIPLLDINHVFHFENFETETFDKWFEINSGIRNYIWSSGNQGFKLTGQGGTSANYPTASYSNGFKGHCVKLTTCDTGDFGFKAKMPIAAGSIYIGDFSSASAMLAPLKATKFGKQIIPENAKPLTLTGYYKYTPGEIVTDKYKNPIEGRRDACSIYSVVFEIDPDKFVPLDGSNITSSDRIVLIAEMKNPGEPTEWTEFSIPFEPRSGKEFDYKKLANNEYAITVVASSSKDGAFFEGAIGSTLYVDELKIEWEEK